MVDEAEGVSEEIYEAIEAIITSADPLLLLIGNPTTMEGAFRRAFFEHRSIYRNITISALDSPNVQAGRVVIPGLTTSEWVDERKQIWQEDSLSRASTKHTSGAEQKCTTREVIGQRKCPRQLFGRSVTEAGWQQAG